MVLLFKSNIYVWGILRVLPKFLQAFILAEVLLMELYRDKKVSIELKKIERNIQEYRDSFDVVDKLEKIWNKSDE